MKPEALVIFRPLFEGDSGTKKKGFIGAIWKKKFLKSHMISGPLDFTSDLWITSQGSRCKKGIGVAVHPRHRTKWQRNAACSCQPVSQVFAKGEPLLQGRRSRAQTCAVLLPLLCSVLPASPGAGQRGRERARLQAVGSSSLGTPGCLVAGSLGLELCDGH